MKGLESGVTLFMGSPYRKTILIIYGNSYHRKEDYKGKHGINQQNQNNTYERIPHEVIHIESLSLDSEKDKHMRKCEEIEREQSSSPP